MVSRLCRYGDDKVAIVCPPDPSLALFYNVSDTVYLSVQHQ